MFDLQKIFTAGVLGIVQQGQLSQRSGDPPQCFYRHPENDQVRCALGHNIPDDQYRPDMEQCVPNLDTFTSTQCTKLARLLGAENQDDCNLLRGFQMQHDGASSVEHFVKRAEGFAFTHNLEMPEGI